MSKLIKRYLAFILLISFSLISAPVAADEECDEFVIDPNDPLFCYGGDPDTAPIDSYVWILIFVGGCFALKGIKNSQLSYLKG